MPSSFVFLKRYSNSSVVSTASEWHVPVSTADTDDYAPFSEFTVYNHTGQFVYFRRGGNSALIEPIPPRSHVTFKGVFYFIKLYNPSSQYAIPASGLVVILRKR